MLFSNLESHLRGFLDHSSKIYEERFLTFRDAQIAVTQAALERLEQSRKLISDASPLIRPFLQHPKARVFAAKTPHVDVPFVISEIYAYTAKHTITRTPTDTVLKYFENPSNPVIPVFIGQIAKLSRNDPAIDLFRQFVLGLYPIHVFLFYSEITTEVRECADPRSRLRLIARTFGPCGWGRLTQAARRAIETQHCGDPQRVPPLCLSMYTHCVSNIKAQVQGTGNIEADLRQMTKLSPKDLFVAVEFMRAIAEGNSVSEQELAIWLFRNRFQFEDALSGFDAAQAALPPPTSPVSPVQSWTKAAVTDGSHEPAPASSDSQKKMDHNDPTDTMTELSD
jgi:hypothetical protein